RSLCSTSLSDCDSFPTRRSCDLSENGIGRLDLVENRYVGMKSRGCYETPGGAIMLKAHRAMETLTLYREVAQSQSLHCPMGLEQDRKSTRLNSSHVSISYAVCCL